jgi:hypothetical protein
VSARVSPEQHGWWTRVSTRNAVIGFFVLAYAGVFFFVGLTRQSKEPPPREPLSQVTFRPLSSPSGLKHVGTSTDGSVEDDWLRREAHFRREGAAQQSSAGPEHDAMTVVTTSYRMGVVNPNLAGRLSGEVYASTRFRPAVRRLIVRGHDGVLEVFPQQPGDRQLGALTWIERPGVCIQIRGFDLPQEQLLDVATSLREQ